MEYKSISKASLKTAVVVGTLLVFLNRYEEIIHMQFSKRDLAKWSLNYVMPFCVSFYSRYMALKKQKKPGNN